MEYYYEDNVRPCILYILDEKEYYEDNVTVYLKEHLDLCIMSFFIARIVWIPRMQTCQSQQSSMREKNERSELNERSECPMQLGV